MFKKIVLGIFAISCIGNGLVAMDHQVAKVTGSKVAPWPILAGYSDEAVRERRREGSSANVAPVDRANKPVYTLERNGRTVILEAVTFVTGSKTANMFMVRFREPAPFIFEIILAKGIDSSSLKKRASAYVKEMVACARTIAFVNLQRIKDLKPEYADVIIDGENLAQHLIREELAKPCSVQTVACTVGAALCEGFDDCCVSSDDDYGVLVE